MGIPTNLEECIAELGLRLTQDSVERIEKMEENEFIAVSHHDIGRRLRNDWDLWKEDSVLSIYFRKLGLWHADDMSGLILRCFHRFLKSELFDVDGQVAFYKKYWIGEGMKEVAKEKK